MHSEFSEEDTEWRQVTGISNLLYQDTENEEFLQVYK